MTQEEKIAYIAKDLPLIKEIKNAALAEQVADVWLRTIELSTWDSIAAMPFSNNFPERSLTEHVNLTTEAALMMARLMKKYHDIEIDEDELLAFALIHDVDKALKYASDGNGGVFVSEMGKQIQHGVMSAMIARDCGMSMKMQHLLITHSPQQNMKPAYREGLMFGFVDHCDWEMVINYGKKSSNVTLGKDG